MADVLLENKYINDVSNDDGHQPNRRVLHSVEKKRECQSTATWAKQSTQSPKRMGVVESGSYIIVFHHFNASTTRSDPCERMGQ
jgi:hypothetical protein